MCNIFKIKSFAHMYMFYFSISCFLVFQMVIGFEVLIIIFILYLLFQSDNLISDVRKHVLQLLHTVLDKFPSS